MNEFNEGLGELSASSSFPDLTIRDLRARAVLAPLALPLETASGQLTRIPLVLIDLRTEEGITGISYLFSPSPLSLKPIITLIDEIADILRGRTVAPLAIEQFLLKKFLLLGGSGLVTMAIAGIDMAAWDAVGKARDLPLVRLWGGEPKPIAAYNSNGLGLMGAKRAADEAALLLESGFSAVKLRLGYETVKQDVEVAAAIRAAIGDDVLLMCDYNQCLTVPEAIRRGQALDAEGLYWIEEPVHADDYPGCAKVAREVKTAIQIGENFWSPRDVHRALSLEACDMIMPDAGKIGGASAWLRAGAIASVTGTPISSHLFPEISAHMLAITPTAHFLEYVDWAAAVLNEPVEVAGGTVTPSLRPGHGMSWDEAAISRYLC